MFLRPFNFYLLMSMCGNLFMLFLCAWFLIGFIEYGIVIGNMYKEKAPTAINTDINDSYFKIFMMILCELFGGFVIYFTLRDEGFNGLRFW